MKLMLTTHLRVAIAPGKLLHLLPVPMAIGFPSRERSSHACLWSKFINPQGKRFCIDDDVFLQILGYMLKHGTEALSEDGVTAYTLAGNTLAECNPDVCDGIEMDRVALAN